MESINQNNTNIQNPQVNALEYTNQNKKQSLIHQQQQPIQNICLVEVPDKNISHLTNNSFNVLNNNSSIQNNQPFTYVITSDANSTYAINNKEIVRHEQLKNTVS